MNPIYYINNQFIHAKEATLSASDLGLIRGYGVFDYLRTYFGKPFHLDDHLQRLKQSAETIGISLPKSLSEIKTLIDELLNKNQFEESSIKIFVTGGLSEDQMIPSSSPSLMIFVYPLQILPEIHYQVGVKTITTPLSRSFPSVKTTYYIPAIMALQKAQDQKASEALHLNALNEILEGTTSNFFGIRGNTLITAEEGILKGITRNLTLQLAKNSLNIQFRAIPYEEISHLDEAFLTSSSKEILPVVSIDSIPIRNEAVGPHTQYLASLFKDYVINHN